ncbi:MAG: DciA family protein [Pseudomonadota bacterium]
MAFPPQNQRPTHIFGTRQRPVAAGASTYLRGNAGLASLMPAAMRMAQLQKDCAAALPPMFSQCDVLQFENAQLVLAMPNAAVAAKLKQSLPKLQAALQKRGWQVDGVRLKVLVTRSLPPVVHTRQLVLPEQAVSAFAQLGEALAPTAQNEGLIAAIKAMAARRR